LEAADGGRAGGGTAVRLAAANSHGIYTYNIILYTTASSIPLRSSVNTSAEHCIENLQCWGGGGGMVARRNSFYCFLQYVYDIYIKS
jgi:hypothetical protein